jgi:tetratricopeptide (TPR) repeat protein
MTRMPGVRSRIFSVAFFLTIVLRLGGWPAFSQETNSTGITTSPSPPGLGAPRATTSTEAGAALRAGEDYFQSGSFDQAIVKFNEVLKSGSLSAEAYTGMVRTYLKQNKIRDATNALAKGRQSQPSARSLQEVQGELLFREGKIHDAEKAFVDLINSGQSPARAYLGLARIHSAIAMYAREHRLILRAHELAPDDQDVEKEWMGTLSRTERIKFLASYLAQPTSDDGDTRNHLRAYLEMLKARQAAPRSACRLVSDVTATETDLIPLLLDSQHLRGLGLPVTINGQKSKLLLDTGAGGITINRKLAARAGVQRLADIHVGGVGDRGEANGYSAYADSIRVGNLEFRNCPVDVIDKRNVAQEEGLIGADVFEQFLIEIDFPNRKLKLSQLPARPGESHLKPSLATDENEPDVESEAKPAEGAGSGGSPSPAPKYFDRYISPEMSSYTRVFRFGHMLLVPTQINDVPGKLFLIDSGAWNNMIAPEAAREVTKIHGDPYTTVKGLNGKVDKVYETGTVFLGFGGLRQKNEDMVAFDLSHLSDNLGTEISGTLGFAMLNLLSIKLDYRDAIVKFEYVPSPWRR